VGQGLRGEDHFSWALEGRAIQDVWVMPRFSERSRDSDHINNMFGTTLRLWDPAVQVSANNNRIVRWTIGCTRNANGISHWSSRPSIHSLINVPMLLKRLWSPNYIQHSAHIAPGREGLFDLIKGLPSTLKYEPGTIVAEGDCVIIHGRFSGFGRPVNWIAADIVRIKDGVLAEHWDVIQDEAARQESKSRLPMFGDSFSK
jgi:predicted SnoaL-like aldol condensation-catalyzing enzyme